MELRVLEKVLGMRRNPGSPLFATTAKKDPPKVKFLLPIEWVLVLGYSTRVSDAPLADVLLAGMVLLAFGAWRRWGRFRGEKNFNKRSWF